MLPQQEHGIIRFQADRPPPQYPIAVKPQRQQALTPVMQIVENTERNFMKNLQHQIEQAEQAKFLSHREKIELIKNEKLKEKNLTE